jgi:hypothetical protein
MSQRVLLFVGGNGHCAARLQPARDTLHVMEGGAPFLLADALLPGFEGRPPAASLDALLAAVAAEVSGRTAPPRAVYASGIGALLVLAARARAAAPPVPLLMQAPVLWGLATRWMPRAMRLAPVRALAGRLFASAPFQRRFWRRQVALPWDDPLRAAFFEGYARCAAFALLFDWITPAWLRGLEADLRARPEALDGVRVLWGGRDPVVGVDELSLTEAVLHVRWPLRVVPEWGHYPLLDRPREWVDVVAAEMDAFARPI